MGTPVNEGFDPIAFTMGKERVLDYALSPEESWELLQSVLRLLQPQWKELGFYKGHAQHVERANINLASLPAEIETIRFMSVYAGQRYQRDDVRGYTRYCITSGQKWFRIFDKPENGEEVSIHVQWLTTADMIEVMREDPSLIKYLLEGLKRNITSAAAKLRTRANDVEKADKKLADILHRFSSLNQPWPVDLPDLTPRLPM